MTRSTGSYDRQDLGAAAAACRALMYLALLTSSFEIFLVLNLGFNFKISQLFVLAAAAIWLASAVRAGSWSLIVPADFYLLLIFLLLSILFAPNSGLPYRSVGYSLWFAFDVLGVILMANTFSSPESFRALIRFMLTSFSVIGGFGLLQFFLGILHLPAPLVTQWWIAGALPRINGFNYEPSFFATYIVIGWILSLYLLEKKDRTVGLRRVRTAAVVTTAALVLCSSRMGWIAIALWLLRPLGKSLLRMLTRHSLARTDFILALKYFTPFALVVTVTFSVFSLEDLSVLIGGLGLIEGGSDYSAAERSETTLETARIALHHPFFGVGLGGIPSEMGRVYGVSIHDLEEAKFFEGKNVSFEIISAVGLFGFLVMALFLFRLCRSALRLSRELSATPNDDDARFLANVLRGLTWALCLELFLLQLNQNFLRVYTWMLIAVLVTAVNRGRRLRAASAA